MTICCLWCCANLACVKQRPSFQQQAESNTLQSICVSIHAIMPLRIVSLSNGLGCNAGFHWTRESEAEHPVQSKKADVVQLAPIDDTEAAIAAAGGGRGVTTDT